MGWSPNSESLPVADIWSKARHRHKDIITNWRSLHHRLLSLRSTVIPEGRGFEGTRYLAKWLVLGALIGLVAGLGAVLFARAIHLATEVLLGGIAGYVPPGPVGEGEPIVRAMTRPWLLPVVTTLGGLVSGIIVFTLAPEAEGHGTDAAIQAIHHDAGRLRGRVAPVKLVASAITIGSGGSPAAKARPRRFRRPSDRSLPPGSD